ncbi:MAG: hypothetical protein E2O29_01760 [Deltaproteobacteria bacterium]|nr:MAG: hypothetical protein E2O29_01760 [Deltaproteobacteria bacterium]
MDITEALHLAENLKNEYGLHNWEIRLSNSKRAFGTCYFGINVIKLSQHLVRLNEVDRVRNTILHEIAHAVAGIGHNHDKVWRDKFISMGGDGKRCYNENDANTPKANYIGKCVNGHERERFRLSRRAHKMACASCCNKYSGGKFDPTYQFTWKRVR